MFCRTCAVVLGLFVFFLSSGSVLAQECSKKASCAMKTECSRKEDAKGTGVILKEWGTERIVYVNPDKTYEYDFFVDDLSEDALKETIKLKVTDLKRRLSSEELNLFSKEAEIFIKFCDEKGKGILGSDGRKTLAVCLKLMSDPAPHVSLKFSVESGLLNPSHPAGNTRKIAFRDPSLQDE